LESGKRKLHFSSKLAYRGGEDVKLKRSKGKRRKNTEVE